MAEEFCSYHLNGLGQLVQFHRTSLLSLCALHFIFSTVATVGNILVIRALWKASLIPANVKKFFLSLAVSDLAVGLFAQVMYAVVLRMAANGGRNFDLLCPTILTVCCFFLTLLACASFLNVTAIAVDRLLANSSPTIPGTCHFRAHHNSLGISLAHKYSRCFPFRSFSYLQRHCSIYLSIRWNSLDNSSVHSYLQSRKTSSESNPQSTSTSRCSSNGTIPGGKGRFQRCAFLRNFCRMLSSEFLLYNIVYNGYLSNFFLVGFSRHISFRSSQFLVKSCSLLLAISRNSSNCEKHSEKNIPHHRELRWNKDALLIRTCIVSY